jgi:hypothetical protein
VEFCRGTIEQGELSIRNQADIAQSALVNDMCLLVPVESTQAATLVKKLETASEHLGELASVNFGMQLRGKRVYRLYGLTPEEIKMVEGERKGKDEGLRLRVEVPAEVGEQTAVPGGRERPDASEQGVRGQGDEESQANQRGGFQSAGRKVGVAGREGFVEVGHTLLEWGADAADEEITEWRQTAQDDDRTVLELAVRLGEWRKGNVALVHGRRSAVVYSGSASP